MEGAHRKGRGVSSVAATALDRAIAAAEFEEAEVRGKATGNRRINTLSVISGGCRPLGTASIISGA
jgi:hypothetical protein